MCSLGDWKAYQSCFWQVYNFITESIWKDNYVHKNFLVVQICREYKGKFKFEKLRKSVGNKTDWSDYSSNFLNLQY